MVSVCLLSLLSFFVMSVSAVDVKERVKHCLATQYELDEQSVAKIMERFKPYIENPEQEQLFERFVELSMAHVDGGTVQYVLPADDPVVAAPKYHEVLGENNKVRVLWGYSVIGDVEPLHRHYWKSILVMLEPGAFEVEYADGSKETIYDFAGVYLLPADAQAATYKNLGFPCSVVRFEIKD